MNILHVVDMISQLKAGGSAKVPFQLGAAQARLGHDVTIFTSDYQADDQKPPLNVSLCKFRCVLNFMGGVRITPSMLLPSYRKYDVVHLHNYRTAVNIIAANQNVPVVLQAHGNAAPLSGRFKGLIDVLCRTAILRRAKACIADAEPEIQHYILEGTKRDKVHFIPVGIDYKEFTGAERTTGDKRRVLFLGRFHQIKGADLLVEAFNLLNRTDVVLAIAGVDYGEETAIKQQIVQLGLQDRIEWLGPLYGKDKVREYARADVYVMPSRYEMFGLTLLEALACGTPVIISDRCGVAPILPTECGAVVPLQVRDLATAIDQFLQDNKAASYREYRKQWAKQYDWSNLVGRVMEVYDGIV